LPTSATYIYFHSKVFHPRLSAHSPIISSPLSPVSVICPVVTRKSPFQLAKAHIFKQNFPTYGGATKGTRGRMVLFHSSSNARPTALIRHLRMASHQPYLRLNKTQPCIPGVITSECSTESGRFLARFFTGSFVLLSASCFIDIA